MAVGTREKESVCFKNKNKISNYCLMPWTICQVCVTKIIEGIWEMRLGLFAEKDKYCSLSRSSLMPRARDSLAVTDRASWGLASADRISRPYRKTTVKIRGPSWKWKQPNFQLPHFQLPLHPASSALSSFANYIGASFGRDFTYPFLCLVSLIFVVFF